LGSPAKESKQQFRSIVALDKLPDLLKELEAQKKK
jgi:hypothetical protein